MIRDLLFNSTRKLPSKEDFPLDLVPATKMVALLSIKKLNNPAAIEFIYLILGCTYNGKVQGKSLCLLKEKAIPEGFNGALMAATLAVNLSVVSSVSRIGFASSKGLPESNLNLVAQLSTSEGVG